MAAFLKRYEIAVFIGLLALSLGLHLWNIARPAEPVFDEAYFTTYAANQALGKVYFDVHPPLGKWLYSLPLLFYPSSTVSRADYITLSHDAATDSLQTNYNPAPYGNFPYLPLRLISVFFGLILAAGFYLLLRTLAGPPAAIGGTFLLVLENALLFDTRFVLMDGMYLAFGIWSLYFLFKERSRPVIAGLLFGLALGVKLTAVVFAGAAAVAWAMGWLRGLKGRDIGRFVIAASVVLLAVEFGLGPILWHPHQTIDFALNTFGWPVLRQIAGNTAALAWFPAALKATLINGMLMVTGYLSGGSQPLMSPWFTWPFMWKPMDVGHHMFIIGNPFVWLSSTAAVIGALWILIRDGWKRRLEDGHGPLLLLLGGYIFCLLPFFTLIHRSTFLYHYFPALLFALGLAGFFIGKLIEKDDFAARLALAAILILTIAGFIIAAPYTYGL